MLAIVSDYAENKGDITCYELKNVVPKSLQGAIGVVEHADIAVKRHDYRVRFFADKTRVFILRTAICLRVRNGDFLISGILLQGQKN